MEGVDADQTTVPCVWLTALLLVADTGILVNRQDVQIRE